MNSNNNSSSSSGWLGPPKHCARTLTHTLKAASPIQAFVPLLHFLPPLISPHLTLTQVRKSVKGLRDFWNISCHLGPPTESRPGSIKKSQPQQSSRQGEQDDSLFFCCRKTHESLFVTQYEICTKHSLKTQNHQHNLSSLPFYFFLISVRACKSVLSLDHVSHVASVWFCMVARDHTSAPITCDLLDAPLECPRLSEHSLETTRVLAGWFQGPSVKTNLIKIS